MAAPARRVAALLEVARQAIAADGTAEDVLWAIWDASGLADRWERLAAAEHDPAADRDLDAVLALFEAAARFTDDLPPGSPRLFLDSLAGQEIAGDTIAEQAVREDCVRVLTAHRSKGLEWDVVVVAGVQEEVWPDLRLRGSLLGADELAEAARPDAIGLDGGLAPGEGGERIAAADVAAAALAARLLAEERRLFYVAVTRARRLLVVTASGGDEQDHRPSRFLAELAGDEIEIQRAGATTRWLSLPALVADLRRTAADTQAPSALRQAAAGQLARLAAAGVRGADPAQWYALTELSDTGPIVPPGERVRLSPSQVESFARCGLRWLLESAAGAGQTDVLRHLGTVIHAAAVLIADGAAERAVAQRIDDIWHHLDFGSAWYGSRQRELAERMVRKFLAWHAGKPAGPAGHRAGAAGAGRPGGDHRPGGPARARRAGQGRHRGPEDRGDRPPRRGPGPSPAAWRLPAGGAARRVRGARHHRAGRRGACAGREGGLHRQGASAAAAPAVRRPGAGMGEGSRGRGRRRHGGAGVPRPGEPGLPDLPGRLLLSGAPGRRATRPMRRLTVPPGTFNGARRYHLWIT